MLTHHVQPIYNNGSDFAAQNFSNLIQLLTARWQFLIHMIIALVGTAIYINLITFYSFDAICNHYLNIPILPFKSSHAMYEK